MWDSFFCSVLVILSVRTVEMQVGYLVTYCAGITKIIPPKKSGIWEVGFLICFFFRWTKVGFNCWWMWKRKGRDDVVFSCLLKILLESSGKRSILFGEKCKSLYTSAWEVFLLFLTVKIDLCVEPHWVSGQFGLHPVLSWAVNLICHLAKHGMTGQFQAEIWI